MWQDPPLLPSLPENIPVFPLPSVVFFPGTVVPLHIFEPRYREMVEDALAGDGIIALTLEQDHKPGFPEASPPIHTTGCAGRMLEVARLEEGRFNIRLAGLGRVQLDEYDSGKSYRMARASLLPEVLPDEQTPATSEARNNLLGAYGLLVAEITGQQSLGLEGARSASFHALVNTLCAHLDMPAELKQQLLSVSDVMERGQLVTDVLRRELSRLSRNSEGGGQGGPTIH